MSEYAAYALIVLLVSTQIYWALLTARLLDRLMSRDYGELVKADKYKKLKPIERAERSERIDLDDDYAASQAERANKVLSF